MGGFMNDSDEWLDGEESKLTEEEIQKKATEYQKSIGLVSKIVDGKLVYVDPDGVQYQEAQLAEQKEKLESQAEKIRDQEEEISKLFD